MSLLSLSDAEARLLVAMRAGYAPSHNVRTYTGLVERGLIMTAEERKAAGVALGECPLTPEGISAATAAIRLQEILLRAAQRRVRSQLEPDVDG